MSRGLGRGLAALIPDSALDVGFDEPVSNVHRVVPVDEIHPNPEQPRQVFDPEALEELSASIAKHGVLSPLVVQRVDGRYELIAGERRLRAAALAGVHEVPVVVRETEGASEQLELALVENLQRTDLDPIEAARGFQRLVDEFGYTQEEVATRVGKNRATIANLIRLLRLPDFALDSLRAGQISAGHARALLPLVDTGSLRDALGTIVTRQLNVRATERLVSRLVKGQPRRARNSPSATLSYATSILSYALRTSVEIKPRKKGGGRIVIDYADGEDLERLIGRLRGEG